MPGEHLDAVVELEQAVERVEQALGSLLCCNRKVGPGRVADEQRVAREDEPGLAAARVVDDGEAAVLGSMARRMDDAERDGTDDDLVAVVHRVVRVVDAGVCMHAHWDPVLERQSAVPRDVVGVRMRLDRAHDSEPAVLGLGEHGLDRERWVDDHGDPRFLVTDQVTRTAQVVIQELVEDHDPTVASGPAV